jgi:uncharacterized membrane protein YgcG
MRVIRLFALVATILTTGLLLATPAGAQPPSKLRDRITDTTGALTDSDRAAVSSAIERLYRDRHIQLWVVYVDNFSRFKPGNWADKTRSASGMGDHDALLAVATNTKLYTFTASPRLLSVDALNSLRSKQIEPAVGARDWSGAAVAAADGLDKSATPVKRSWLPIAIVLVAVAAIVVVAFVLYRARRRRRAARRAGPDGGQVNIAAGDHSLEQALSTADARLRQISDYVANHGDSIGAEAKARLEEAKRQFAAAQGKEASDEPEAIAHANAASTLAAQAQTLANADVLAAHGKRRRRGTASAR